MGLKKGQRVSSSIASSISIGGYDYLHFWLSHARLGAANFEQAKQKVLVEQLQHFMTVRMEQAVISGDASEIYSLMNTVGRVGQGLDSYIQEVFGDQLAPTGSAFSGITMGGEAKSFSQMGQFGRSPGSLSSLTSQLGSALIEAQQQTQNTLLELENFISQYYPNVVDMAMKSAATYQQTFNNDAQALLSDVIKSGNKAYMLPESMGNEAKIHNSLVRLKMLATAIPLIGSATGIKKMTATYSSNSAVRVRSKSQLLAIILGKIGGNLSAVGGIAEEIAAGVGLERALKEGAQLAASVDFTGANVKMDPQLKADAARPIDAIIQGKDDAQITVTKDAVRVTFGVSVKRATTKNRYGNAIPVNISLEKGTSLAVVLSKAASAGVVDKYYIYNLAGGVERKGESGAQAAWKSLVDYAVTLHFLDALVGNGKGENNNSLIMVVNRQLIPMKDLIVKSIQSPNAINYTGGKQRFKFWKINYNNWVGKEVGTNLDRVSAEQRSARAKGEIYEAFAGTKINMMLNLGALGYHF